MAVDLHRNGGLASLELRVEGVVGARWWGYGTGRLLTTIIVWHLGGAGVLVALVLALTPALVVTASAVTAMASAAAASSA
jgi:hypothetical protein